jgi:tetratricopeptide (TPR) repeat protein
LPARDTSTNVVTSSILFGRLGFNSFTACCSVSSIATGEVFASYDRLRRFDLADQAYATAIKLTGETVQILNDRGYSYLLRGDLGKARAKFLRAYQLGPTNGRAGLYRLAHEAV